MLSYTSDILSISLSNAYTIRVMYSHVCKFLRYWHIGDHLFSEKTFLLILLLHLLTKTSPMYEFNII